MNIYFWIVPIGVITVLLGTIAGLLHGILNELTALRAQVRAGNTDRVTLLRQLIAVMRVKQ